MSKLESSLHLFQPPLYIGEDGNWRESYADALGGCKTSLSWDPAAILSVLSFNYPCGDRTLIKEVKRQPWLCEIDDDGEVCLSDIPPHGRLWKEPKEIATTLEGLLCREAARVCQDFKEIYILLSGGLDSRIVAGVLAKLFNTGRITTRPVGVTWGLEDSRDVVYGREVASILGFDWKHITIGPDTLVDNIDAGVDVLGCLVPPNHLHCMQWFKNVSNDALVLAGSYGDSVGRAEFSRRHLVELSSLRPSNMFGLLNEDVLSSAHEGIMLDLKNLHNRFSGVPAYVHCEHEMQGFYMRGMIAHAMTVINQYCTSYQMFSDPEVYGYMWSIHPVCRDDRAYAVLLEKLNPLLAHLPWARTNRAMKGRTDGAVPNLRKDFHDYAAWIRGPIIDKYDSYIDPDWFAGTGLFNPDSIISLKASIVRNDIALRLYGIRAYEIFLWLVAFRRFSEFLAKSVKTVALDDDDVHTVPAYLVPKDRYSKIRRVLSNSKTLYALNKKMRRYILKRWMLRAYPTTTTTKRERL